MDEVNVYDTTMPTTCDLRLGASLLPAKDSFTLTMFDRVESSFKAVLTAHLSTR